MHTDKYLRYILRPQLLHPHPCMRILNIVIASYFTNSNSYATTHGLRCHVPRPDTLSISEAKASQGVSNSTAVPFFSSYLWIRTTIRKCPHENNPRPKYPATART